jgi:hypothetical protein
MQASNIIIQAAPSNGQLQNHVDEGHTVEDQQQQATADAGAEISTVRFEIHTDEHGQIISIQPAVLQEISSRNGRPQIYISKNVGSYHQSMAHSQVLDRGDCLKIWRVAVNM